MIGKNLKYYRLVSGLSQQQLADSIGISKMAISNYENNKREADSQTIIKLADALHIKAAALIKTSIGKATITHGEFRRKSGMTEAAEELLLETLDRRLGNLNSIITVLGSSVLPEMTTPSKTAFTDIENAGQQMREYLSVSRTGPIGNITDILENKGILICYIDVDDRWFSGINGTVNDRPYIAVNGNMPAERQRFTLIHELAHILFTFDENMNIEKAIDGIAGAFLFPAEDVKRELGLSRTNICGDLRPLQREYGISMQSVLIRAKQVGTITGAVYESHQKWLSKQGLRKNEQSGLAAEHSTLFEQLVIRGVTEGIINFGKAMELLEQPYDKVQMLCAGEA